MKRRNYADVGPVRTYEDLTKFEDALKNPLSRGPRPMIAAVLIAAGLMFLGATLGAQRPATAGTACPISQPLG